MRVLVAGSSGVIGRQLVPMLQEDGHKVVGLARTADSALVKVITTDALDRDAFPAELATAWTARL